MTNQLATRSQNDIQKLPADIAEARRRDAGIRQIIRDNYAKGATDEELDFIGKYCEKNQLDLFAGQVNVVERRYFDQASKTWKRVLNIFPSVHGYLSKAERSGNYDSVGDEEWLDETGAWQDVWFDPQKLPIAARCTVYKRDGRPQRGTVMFAEKAQYKDGRLMGNWATGPAEMLMKCAIVRALKMAFPNQVQNVEARHEAPIAAAHSVGLSEGETMLVDGDATGDAPLEGAYRDSDAPPAGDNRAPTANDDESAGGGRGEAEEQQKSQTACEVCHKDLKPGQIAVSMNKYQRVLCPDHQRTAAEGGVE